MSLFLFIAQVLLFFLFFWIFKKKHSDLRDLIERINEQVYVGILILLSVCLPFLYIGDGHDWGGDFSCYIAQAQSILSGTMKEQVEANTFIVSNSAFMPGPGSYPWGFPLLLAPVIQIFGVNYIALKCVNIVFLMLSTVLFYSILKEKISLAYARLGVFFLLANPYILYMCNQVLSDIPFLFFSLLCVYFIEKLFLSQKKQIIYAVATGLSCFCAYFVRTNGLVAVLTIFAIECLLLITKIRPLGKLRSKLAIPKQKPLAHIIAYAVFFCGVILDKLIFPTGGTGYGYYFELLSINSLLTNFKGYFTDCCNFFTMNIGPSFPLIFLLALLFVYGIKKELHKELVSVIYILGMFALIVIFPAYQGIRYLLTIPPFMIVLCLKALDNIESNVITEKRAKSTYRLVVSAFLCVIIASVAFTTGSRAKDAVLNDINQEENSSYTENALETYAYIKTNTDEDDVIAFFRPRVLWLNTHRKSFLIMGSNLDRLNDVDYVLFAEGHINEQVKELCENSETATIVFSNEEFTLYRMGE